MKLLRRESRTANSRFAKAGVSCFYESVLLNLSFVHQMNFSAKNPRLRKAANRCLQVFGIYPAIMKQIFGILFLLFIVACNDRTQKTDTIRIDTTSKLTSAIKSNNSPTVSNPYGFDKSYKISKEHTPFMVTGYFNLDNVLDTAILIRQKSTNKDALFIKHGGTDQFFLIKNGKDIEAEFDNFNWVGQFEVIQKGAKIWDNVIDGEIVGADQVPESKKITLKTEAIFIHEDEGGGGGIIYFKNNKYVWMQQD